MVNLAIILSVGTVGDYNKSNTGKEQGTLQTKDGGRIIGKRYVSNIKITTTKTMSEVKK